MLPPAVAAKVTVTLGTALPSESFSTTVARPAALPTVALEGADTTEIEPAPEAVTLVLSVTGDTAAIETVTERAPEVLSVTGSEATPAESAGAAGRTAAGSVEVMVMAALEPVAVFPNESSAATVSVEMAPATTEGGRPVTERLAAAPAIAV